MTSLSPQKKHAVPPDMIEVLNPEGIAEPERLALARRVDNLSGKTVGLLDNSKPNFHRLLDKVDELLRRDYKIGKTVRIRKTSAGAPVRPDALKRLEGECDVVITGSCD